MTSSILLLYILPHAHTQSQTDKRSDITNNPDRADDPEYIVRLIKQVVTVSVETVKIVEELPELENTQHEH